MAGKHTAGPLKKEKVLLEPSNIIREVLQSET
jgi:hypothetical protein